jgi:uncharacterized membrane protein YfcA
MSQRVVPQTWAVPADALIALAFGFGVAVITTPVGVSGAVFLLPVQMDVLGVPNPSVTPTNLLFNVIAGPGALWRHRRAGTLVSPLLGRMLLGTVPGVVVGAVLRVTLVPDVRAFRLVAAAVLLGLGLWLLVRLRHASRPRPPVPGRAVTAAALAVGVVGGVYGIGGGSLLAPWLAGRGWSVSAVAPAALASTFVTSLVGIVAFSVMAVSADGSIAPDWTLGLTAGVGGLVGGYVGAALAPRLPEQDLRAVLGALAISVAAVYGSLAVR